MPFSLKPPPLADVLGSTFSYARRAREQVAAGLSDALVASLRPPRASEHFRRFVFGLSLPLSLLRVACGNPRARASLRRRLLPPILVLAFVSVGFGVTTLVTLAKARHDPSVLVEEAEEKAIPPPSGFLGIGRALGRFVTSKIAKVYAALSVIEWILVWIGREHHDQIAYETAMLTGVPGEELPHPPRLHLDAAWLKLKGWRALRLLLFLAVAAPFAWLLGLIPVVGDALGVALEASWAIYWAAVFACANSALAWEEPAPREGPWFMRGLTLLGRIPLLGLVVRFYAALVRLATVPVWPACMACEETFWESLGLALARAIASIPFLYLISRPVFATAATHAFLARVAPPA